MTTFAEPSSTANLRGLLLDYLDFYRNAALAKARGLDDDALRTSNVPSGWSVAGLLNHLAFMERRWLRWGFMAEQVDDPWGDAEGDGWVTPSDSLDELTDRLHAAGQRTRAIVEAHDLSARAAVGGHFTSADEAPQLHWILLHVLQEYARHAGHLDIARELRDGTVGESD